MQQEVAETRWVSVARDVHDEGRVSSGIMREPRSELRAKDHNLGNERGIVRRWALITKGTRVAGGGTCPANLRSSILRPILDHPTSLPGLWSARGVKW